MSYRRALLAVLTVALLFCRTRAQSRREPLNDLEIDQLRDVALDPDLRLKLYVKFAAARLNNLAEARADPKITDRPQEIHDRLQDFLDVYDELNDNIDTYVDRRSDLRHALKPVIEADAEFHSKLRAFEDALAAGHQPMDTYQFLLSNALSTLESSAQDHRQLLKDQEAAAKSKKANKAAGAEGPS